MPGNSGGDRFNHAAVFFMYLVVLSMILVLYLWLTQDQPSLYRDAAFAVIVGFAGSVVYAAWKRGWLQK